MKTKQIGEEKPKWEYLTLVNKFGKFMGDSIEMKRIIKIGKFILFKTK